MPDMQFEELPEGAGPPTVASRRLAAHDASHVVHITMGSDKAVNCSQVV